MTSQNLLANTARLNFTNRSQKAGFAVLTILIALACAFFARYLIAPKPLIFAVGPENSVEYAFAQRLSTAMAANRRLRIVVSSFDSNAAAASQFAQGKADLSIARTDTKIPGRARAVAILDHSLLLIGVPKSAKPKAIGALKGKRLAIIGDDVRDSALVKQLLTLYDSLPATPIEDKHAGDWPKLFEPNGPAAVFYMIRKSEIATEKFLTGRGQKPNFDLLEVDGSKAMANRIRGASAETIDAGAIIPSPKLPADDLETLGADDLLLCSSRLSEALGTQLADVVFENKDQLGEPGRYATNIEPPSTDKDAVPLAHPGVAQYVDDDTKTFFDRYSDLIYIGMSVASIVGSIFIGLYSTVTRASPVHAGQLTDRILELAERAGAAQTIDDICALDEELNALLAEVLGGVRDGSIASQGFDAFRLAFDIARDAINAKKDLILARPQTPVKSVGA